MKQTLIERLERATGKSRLLDFEIRIAIAGDPIWPTMDRAGRIINPHARMSDYLATYRNVIDADDQDFDFPRYTASIDAALTLLPKGMHWQAGIFNLDGKGRAELAEPVKTQFGPAIGMRQQTCAITPAIALCIAALQAHGQSPT